MPNVGKLLPILLDQPIDENELIQNSCEVYEAEMLDHRFGDVVSDDDAYNKQSWFADLSKADSHPIYGPYKNIGDLGEYTAYFKIKIKDNTLDKSAILLDVHGVDEKEVDVQLTVSASDFIEPLTYQIFKLRFDHTVIDRLEYRVKNPYLQNNKIWIDYIAVVKTEASAANTKATIASKILPKLKAFNDWFTKPVIVGVSSTVIAAFVLYLFTR